MAVVFDLDGVLNIMANERNRALVEARATMGKDWADTFNWEWFHEQSAYDQANPPMVGLLLRLRQLEQVFIVTARPREYYQLTQQWLKLNGIPYDRLVLARKSLVDRRHDWEVKEIEACSLKVERVPISIVVEDRKCVADMWRRQGFNCLQYLRTDL